MNMSVQPTTQGGIASNLLWSEPTGKREFDDGALVAMPVPANISSVLWKLSSTAERYTLLGASAATAVAAVSVAGSSGGETVNVPIRRSDTFETFDRRIVEAAAEKAGLVGQSRADFIQSNLNATLSFDGKTGQAAFDAIYASKITNGIQTRMVAVDIENLLKSAADHEAGRTAVQRAVDAVRSELGGEWVPIGRDDAERALAQINGLSDVDKRAVVNELGKDGSLDRLAQAITQDSTITNLISGGMTADQQRTAMDNLVKGLGGSELELLSNAFARAPGWMGGYDATTRFADAIGANASPDAKRDFIMANIGAMRDGANFTQTGAFNSNRIINADIDAVAASRVLASMDAWLPQTREAWNALANQPDQLRGVIDASVNRTEKLGKRGGFEGRAPTYDPSTYETLMRKAAALPASTPAQKTENDQLRATVFELATGAFTMTRVGENEGRLTAALVPIVNASANTIVQRATGDGFTGNTLKPYIASLIATGNYAAIGDLKDRLARGDDLCGDPRTRFSEGNTSGRLGWLAGTVQRVLDDNKADDKAQLDTWAAIGKTGLKLADKFAPKSVGVPASILSEWVGLGLQRTVGSTNTQASETLRGSSPAPGPEPTEVEKRETSYFEAMVQRAQRAP